MGVGRFKCCFGSGVVMPAVLFDPLDPDHRLQRMRERMAFFYQTDMVPAVGLASAAVLLMVFYGYGVATGRLWNANEET